MNFDDVSFGICWYNDPSIFRCLDSLPKQALKIIVDGKFEYSNSKQELSDESLRKKVLEYENVILIDAPNIPEPEKRNKYLENNDKKYLIIIDSDDYIQHAEWDRALEFIRKIEVGVHDIFIETDKQGGIGSYPRLWVYPKNYRYRLCHNIWTDTVRGIVYKSGNTGGLQVPGILIGTDDDLRSDNYLKMTSEYQGKMMVFEKPYRKKYREGDHSPFI